jgi:hypothetical protein
LCGEGFTFHHPSDRHSHVLDVGHFLEGVACDMGFDLVLAKTGGPFGFDHAGGDAVDADFGGEGLGQTLCRVNCSCLGD